MKDEEREAEIRRKLQDALGIIDSLAILNGFEIHNGIVREMSKEEKRKFGWIQE